MTSLNHKTRSMLETAAHQLWPYLTELSNNWRQSYQQIYPEDPEQIIKYLNKFNMGTLADCLKKGDLEACYEKVSYYGQRLAKLGVPEKKLSTSLRLYLQKARALLRMRYPDSTVADRIISALEQLQMVEMMVAHQAYSSIESKGTEALLSVMDAQLATEQLDDFLHQLLLLSIEAMHATNGRIILINEDQPDEIRFNLDTTRPLARRYRIDRHRRRLVERSIRNALKQNELSFLHTNERNLSPSRRKHVRSIWVFPIKLKTQAIGVLLLRFAKRFECLPKERELMESLLGRAVLAIERVLLMERLRIKEIRIRELTEYILTSQDEERRRISRELHDETSHSLLVLKLYLEMVQKELPSSLIIAGKKVKAAIQLVEKTLKELRRLISDLGPAMLDDYGLAGAIRWYVKTMHDYLPMKVHLKVNIEFQRLPRNLEVAIYRIVQEALNNAARHSKASEVAVGISSDAESIGIIINDNGIGFSTERLIELKRKRAFGLFGMQERVSLLGGKFSLSSQRGKGTTIEIRLPMIEK
ncbi:MAG: GAF domain-containing sensor histidine kinase [Acidobacteriota bacterium]